MSNYKIEHYQNCPFWFVCKRFCFFFFKLVTYFVSFEEAYGFIESQKDYNRKPIIVKCRKELVYD